MRVGEGIGISQIDPSIVPSRVGENIDPAIVPHVLVPGDYPLGRMEWELSSLAAQLGQSTDSVKDWISKTFGIKAESQDKILEAAKKIKGILSQKGVKPTALRPPSLPPSMLAPPQEPSKIPWVPIAIAGGGVLILVVVLLLVRK